MKNVLLSLVIYALPVVLMFLTFKLTGQRPWKENSKGKTEAAKAGEKKEQSTNND